jgi:hypothetical protein
MANPINIRLAAAFIAFFAASAYAKDGPPTPTLEQLPLKDSVIQNGITWTFDKPARVGQFITGDPYVVGPVTIKAIDPKPTFGDEVQGAPEDLGDSLESHYKPQYARNGSTLNMPAVVPPSKITPRAERSGFDSRMPMLAYDPDQFAKLPIAMKAGDSLVSSISVTDKFSGYPVKALAVLTCVGEPQPPDAFRPSFCQSATCKPYLARNLRRDLLLNLPRPASAVVKPADFARTFSQTLWIDTVGFGRALPRISFPFNGAPIADMGGAGSLLLQLDYKPEEKEPLLIAMTQVGIDLYGIVRDGGGWPAEGICGSGRKWIIVFSGVMLGDPQMAQVSKTYPDAEFQEDEQTAFLPIEYGGKTHEKTTGGAKVFWTGHYGIRHGDFPINKWAGGWGPTDLFPPAEWPSPWPRAESDRRGTSSSHWVGEALCARLMHLENTWGHDAFFAYVDRWMTEDDSALLDAVKKNWDDKIAAKAFPDAELKKQIDARAKWVPVPQRTVEGPSPLIPLIKELWSTYRDNLPPAADGTKTPPAESTWK